MSKRPVFEFTGQINKVTTKRDGGGRVELDFGGESIVPIQMIQQLQCQGEVNFAIVMAPWFPAKGERRPKISVEHYLDDTDNIADIDPGMEETE